MRRIRTYASGEKTIDTFIQPRASGVSRFVDVTALGYSHPGITTEYRYNDSIRFVFHGYSENKKNDDYIKIFYFKTGVPDISRLSYDYIHVEDTWVGKDFSTYSDMATHFFNYNPDNPVEGWYSNTLRIGGDALLILLSEDGQYVTWVRDYMVSIRYIDRFLYLDGQMFDFSEYRMTHNFDVHEEPLTLADGTPAKVLTHALKTKYCGRDYFMAAIDTIYQLPK